MKIMKTLVGIFVFILSICTPAYATQQETPLMAAVSVKSTFKLNISATTLEFGSVDPGMASSRKTVGINCVTNNNRPWSVSVYSQSPLSYEQFEIPASNFRWEASVLSGTGQVTPEGDVKLTPTSFYTAGLDDYITVDPVELALTFYVNVPLGQYAGTYRTAVIISMVEE